VIRSDVSRLVAIGDSTVEGLEDPGPDGVYVGWADRFAGHLNAVHPGLLYANLAVRGQTANEVRQTQLRGAVHLRPDVAVMMAGVNDVLRPRLDRAALRHDLNALHSGLAATGATVLTLTMPDMARVAPLAVVLRGRIEYLNAVTRACADRYGSIVVDLASVSAARHPALWHTDRLHANSEGHRRIAAGLAEALGYEVPDWRAEPPSVPPESRATIAVREAVWAVTNLLPWVWEHMRSRPPEAPAVCKRPDLLPCADPDPATWAGSPARRVNG